LSLYKAIKVQYRFRIVLQFPTTVPSTLPALGYTYVYLLPHYKAASLACGSSCSFVCVSSSRLLALCTNSMLSLLLCVLREVESAVVTRLLQTHCLPSHADMPAMTVHIGLTDMLTIAGNAVRCLFQFKQLNFRK
jgi:hypothetical protein